MSTSTKRPSRCWRVEGQALHLQYQREQRPVHEADTVDHRWRRLGGRHWLPRRRPRPCFGNNVNAIVLDTEMYSNMGGQKSKATNLGSVCKFAVGCCQRPKKGLGAIAMAYGDVNVVCLLGANPMQAFKEIESSNGVLLIITFCLCNEQGVVLANSIKEQKLAVESGYWSRCQSDPHLAAQGRQRCTSARRRFVRTLRGSSPARTASTSSPTRRSMLSTCSTSACSMRTSTRSLLV